MAKKLLSIVVPTKNRYYYLKYLIELISKINTEELEMVIQDNSDDNAEFLDYLSKHSYDFVRYEYIQGQIPMSDNADRGILNSCGNYVCFIGDDDGVTRYIIDAAHWMERNNVEAIKPATPNYCWPDAPQGRTADLMYYPFSSKITFINPLEELHKSLKGGFCNRGNMPLAYHAIVRRDVLDRVYNQCGTYFPGNSPDISNAVALSLVVTKYAIIDLPIAYSGSSAYKGGGVFARGNAAPGIDQIPWFRPNPIERWNKLLPRIAEGSIIWADSALESLKRMGRDDLVSDFGLYRCYTNLMISNHRLSNYVYDVCKNKPILYTTYINTFIRRAVSSIKTRVGRLIGLKSGPQYVSNIQNILEASKKLEELADFTVLK